MRVLFVTHYTNYHGANRSLINLIEGSKAYGVDSYVAVPAEGQITDQLKKRNIPYYICPIRYWMAKSADGRGERLFANSIAALWICFKALLLRVDVIFSNSSVTPAGAFAAFMLKRPHVWTIREFGHADYKHKHDWGRKLFEKWVNRADAVIAISNAVKNEVLYNVSAPIYVIYNGVVSWQKAEAIKEGIAPFVNKDGYIFAMLSQINRRKGQHTAIEALAKVKEEHPEIRLLIAGRYSGGENNAFRELSVSLGVERNVEFLGYVEDPFSVLTGCDAVLMCSENEAMGRVTAEAFICGKPVIGYNGAGTKELITEGKTGFLYSNGSEGLASKMRQFIESQEEAYRMGLSAREEAVDKFTSEVYAEQVCRVLEGVIRKQWGIKTE